MSRMLKIKIKQGKICIRHTTQAGGALLILLVVIDLGVGLLLLGKSHRWMIYLST